MIKLPLGLRQALGSGDCVLFLGAGVGAHYKRPNGTSAPDGSQLARDLNARFKLGIVSRAITSADLPRLSQLIEIRNSQTELDSFLKKALANVPMASYFYHELR
jgi:hypothetical protein